jgi:hypothetical protein
MGFALLNPSYALYRSDAKDRLTYGFPRMAEGSPIVSWIIDLQGSPTDLSNWAIWFSSGEFHVECERTIGSPPRYYLHSSRFDRLPDTAIYEAAREILTSMSGIAKTWRGSDGPVIMGLPVTVCEDGSRVPLTRVESAIPLQIEFLRSVRQPPLSERLSDWVDLAVGNPQVKLALKYFSEPDNWISFYKTYEVIRAAVGGEQNLCSKGWLSKSTLENLRRTANMPRHLEGKSKPPKQPLGLSEARNHLSTILRCWLRELAAASTS